MQKYICNSCNTRVVIRSLADSLTIPCPFCSPETPVTFTTTRIVIPGGISAPVTNNPKMAVADTAKPSGTGTVTLSPGAGKLITPNVPKQS